MAIREGAALWYLKQSVAARVARYTIGVGCTFQYDQKDPEHYARRDYIRTNSMCVSLPVISFADLLGAVERNESETALIPCSQR